MYFSPMYFNWNTKLLVHTQGTVGFPQSRLLSRSTEISTVGKHRAVEKGERRSAAIGPKN